MTSILVVEDQASLRALTCSALRSGGAWNIRCAGDGVEALQHMRREPVHILLTDVEMPRMDGLELVRQLRRDPTLAAIAVIMLTSNRSARVVRNALELGVCGFVAKPPTAAALHAAIRRALGPSRAVA